jgi:hypothetical protein
MEISCKAIEHLISENKPGFVYFGDRESLQLEGEMHYLHLLSSIDFFNFADVPILWFFNTDPTCRENRGLPSDKPSVVLYVNQDFRPFVLNGETDDLSFANLFNWVSLSVS